jgi:hypothetical protein
MAEDFIPTHQRVEVMGSQALIQRYMDVCWNDPDPWSYMESVFVPED